MTKTFDDLDIHPIIIEIIRANPPEKFAAMFTAMGRQTGKTETVQEMVDDMLGINTENTND